MTAVGCRASLSHMEEKLTRRLTIRLTESEYTSIFDLAVEEERKGADMARILLGAAVMAWVKRDFSASYLFQRIEEGLKRVE